MRGFADCGIAWLGYIWLLRFDPDCHVGAGMPGGGASDAGAVVVTPGRAKAPMGVGRSSRARAVRRNMPSRIRSDIACTRKMIRSMQSKSAYNLGTVLQSRGAVQRAREQYGLLMRGIRNILRRLLRSGDLAGKPSLVPLTAGACQARSRCDLVGGFEMLFC